MISNLELYGTNDVPPVPKEVALERIVLLKKHLKTIDVSNSYTTKLILDAIDHWTKLANLADVGV